MKFKNFSSSAVAVLTIALGGVGLSAVSAMTPLTQSAQSQTYLPFPKEKSYQVTQSWQSSGSHSAGARFAYANQYGVDFGMPINSEVAAVRPGKVIHAWSGGSQLPRGCKEAYANNANYVVIDHNDGKSSIYLHLNAANVKAGDLVKQGQIIGLSGDTGYTCNSTGGRGPHLHFGFQNTTSRIYGNSIPVGFVETGNGKPVQGRTYTSQNPGTSITGIKLLVSKATGRALDAGGANSSVYMHGQPMQGNTYHQWRLEPINGGSEYMLISMATGKALDAGGANGGVYQHGNPNSANSYHRWKLTQVGDASLITSVATGRALDSGGANGTQAYTHPTPMSGNNYHLWRLQ